jgi:hypothetical protein
MDHWKATVPGYHEPTFCSQIDDDSVVYAFLPVDSIANHVNDPHVHYHLCGKDTIPLMTDKTTRILADTRQSRPCVVKTTHSMGKKGIFVIRDDREEQDFMDVWKKSGEPPYIVTDYVDIARNVACHFFIHPTTNQVTWFGSNENLPNDDGSWSSDSCLTIPNQKKLRDLQLPFVKDVVRYAKSLGFWGFCGIDVLFDASGKGYLVDVNPRVTGSSPALMVGRLLKKEYGFDYGLFRGTGANRFHGTLEEMFQQVAEYNEANEGSSRIVIFSANPNNTTDIGNKNVVMNLGVYGHSMEECQTVLNQFAHPQRRTT